MRYFVVSAEMPESYQVPFEQYPKVMGVCDREDVSALTEQECKAVIEIASLRNQRMEMELEAVYFRGCYDSVGYLKKAGIL